MTLLAAAIFALAPSSFVIRHVTVIDGTGHRPMRNVSVYVEGDRIVGVGRPKVPAGTREIDGEGKFLIPGLWDMHVHGTGSPYFSSLYIANGVTGTRDMFTAMNFVRGERKFAAENNYPMPEVVAAGRILDGPKPYWPGSFVVSNAEEGRAAVGKALDEGSEFIKVYERWPRDAYFAIVEEAKRRKVPFEGHVPQALTAFEVAEAGQHSIEHLSGFLRSTNRHPELADTIPAADKTKYQLDTDPKKEKALIQLYAKKKTWQCPTLTVLRSVYTPTEEEVRIPEADKYMRRITMAMWNRPLKQSLPQLEGGRALLRKMKDVVRDMNRAKVPLLAGTDVMNPYVVPGFSLHDELALLVSSGLTPMQALQSATQNPAKFFGKEREFGTIRTGLRADMVLLDANPLADIQNTRKIRTVFRAGRELDRKTLDDMLAEAAAAAHPAKKN